MHLLKRLIILFLFISVFPGCSFFESEKKDYVGYYQINWTDDGAIFSSKRQSRIDHGGHPDGGDEILAEMHQVVKIDPVTLIETTILEVPWGNEISSLSGLGTIDLFAYLIRDNQLKILKNGELQSHGALSFSFKFPRIVWSPDKQHFGISDKDEKFFIYDSNGNLVKESGDGGYIVWKNNQELFFYTRALQKVAIYNIQSDAISILNHDIQPDFYDTDQNKLLAVKEGVLFTCDLDLNSIATKNLSYDFSTLDAHYFSPDGSKLALSKNKVYQSAFSPSFQSDQPSFGIYLYDLETDVLTKVRD